MKWLTLFASCVLCLQSIRIYMTEEGVCLYIESKDHTYDCTDDVKLDTACWDEDGTTQLCGALWIEVKTEAEK